MTNNPRYQKADANIRKAFLKLFEQKGIEEITTSEIIHDAGVNRSTFYAHYTDKYDLLDAIEKDFIAQMKDILMNSPTMGLLRGKESDTAVWESYFGRLIDFLNANKQLFGGLVSRSDSSFMVDFSCAFAQVLARSGASSKLGIPLNYESSMLAWATAGLVDEWARGGFVDNRDNVVRILVSVATGIQSVILE